MFCVWNLEFGFVLFWILYFLTLEFGLLILEFSILASGFWLIWILFFDFRV